MIRAHGTESHEVQSAMALEQEVFSHAARVVVTTPRIRARVLELYQVPPERVRVIPNYVDVSCFAPRRDIVRNPRLLCYVGRLDPEKNPGVLIQAISGLDVELVMVGNGSLRKTLEAEAEQAHVSVRFLGNVPNPDLPAILNRATLFVMPSLLEGHPKALLEAMACGLPVIGTNVQGIRELIRHRETGYLAECTVEGLRGAIREVLADRALQAQLGAAARAYVERHCSLEMVVSMEYELLHDILHCP
jgi:glycosyltransferase involved in cell wall biosynthesis